MRLSYESWETRGDIPAKRDLRRNTTLQKQEEEVDVRLVGIEQEFGTQRDGMSGEHTLFSYSSWLVEVRGLGELTQIKIMHWLSMLSHFNTNSFLELAPV